jgi:pimeloyl-ACP methyl ester carboxylesterase
MRGEFLDLGGARIYYYAAGTRGAGNPVVLIHGFPTSSHLWNDVVPFVPPGHRVVVLDLLGYGRSDRPKRHAVDIAAHSARVVALLDELRIERACLVGHGMGGGIAQWITARHSQRVSHLCLVDSVSIGNSAAGFEPGSVHRGVSRASRLPLLQALPPAVLLALLRGDLSRGYTDASRASRSVELYLRPFAGAEGRDALVAHMRAGKRVAESTVDLKSVRVPAVMVWGENDRAIPLAVGIQLRDAIEGATLSVVPGVRHFTPEEAPREIAEAIRELLRR